MVEYGYLIVILQLNKLPKNTEYNVVSEVCGLKPVDVAYLVINDQGTLIYGTLLLTIGAIEEPR